MQLHHACSSMTQHEILQHSNIHPKKNIFKPKKTQTIFGINPSDSPPKKPGQISPQVTCKRVLEMAAQADASLRSIGLDAPGGYAKHPRGKPEDLDGWNTILFLFWD